MTVHMIRLYVGPNDKMTLEQAQEAWQTWVDNHSEWIEDATQHTLTETERVDGHIYWTGTCRFLLDDAKANLIQKCEDKWTDKVDWYRIGYHECSHDADNPTACTWDEKRDWPDGVTVPSWVPGMEVA